MRADRRELDLLVIGEINPDVLVSGNDVQPHFGQVERLVNTIALVVGSSSAIVACGAARLGLRTGMIGVVGDDALGRFMLTALAERGVEVSGCVVDPALPTGASVILSEGAERAILTAPGAIGALRAEHVPPDAMHRARHLHLGSYFLQEAAQAELPELFRQARAAGLSTSFDCNWDPAERWDGGIDQMLAVADLFFPNSEEARRLTGCADDEQAARALAEQAAAAGGTLTVALKRGAAGGLALRGEELVYASPPPVEVVDTTGAGDSFDAGFLCGWLAGRSLRGCLELAVACGSLSTRALGGTAAQPTLAEAEAVLRR